MADLDQALAIDPNHFESRYLRGVVLHGLGSFKRAIADYSHVLTVNSAHRSYYQREIARYQSATLDKSLAEVNLDADLNPYFKEAWCKTHPPSLLSNYKAQSSALGKDVELLESARTREGNAIVAAAEPIGELLHLRSPGYLSNKRQQRFAGLAAIDVAQRIRRAWSPEGLQVDGRSSSAVRVPHEFGWRDAYDIAVRWRQLSEVCIVVDDQCSAVYSRMIQCIG